MGFTLQRKIFIGESEWKVRGLMVKDNYYVVGLLIDSLGMAFCEMSVLCYVDCVSILLMYHSKSQKKF